MKTYTLPILDRQGRSCDPKEVVRQVGRMNILAISGGIWGTLRENQHEQWEDPRAIIGVFMPCGTARMVEVTLDWDDTYRVRRVRRITRGADRNNGVVEFEQTGVYCDELAEVAYRASCWR